MGIAVPEYEFHILAVDDSLIDRKLIERLLKTSSYQVTTVDSGSKALEFLGLQEENGNKNQNSPSVSPNNHQEVKVNLIITDYCMPGMTGYDLLKKIKESSSLRNIPVVIMSSENVPSRINRCLKEGAEEFFLKPVKRSDLNKLRPYMMRTKVKNQKPEGEENLEELQEPPPAVHSQQQLPQHHSQPPLSPLQPPPQQQQQQWHSQLPSLPGLSPSLQQQTPQHSQPPVLLALPLTEQQQTHPESQLPSQQQPQQHSQPPTFPVSVPSQQQQQQQHTAINNKRKEMEEELSSDRTRPRYNGIATMV